MMIDLLICYGNETDIYRYEYHIVKMHFNTIAPNPINVK